MKRSELRQLIREEIEAAANPADTSNQSNVKGSIETLKMALKGIGIDDENISMVLNKAKNPETKLTNSDNMVLANVFKQMMRSTDSTALVKVFTALKNMGAK